MKTFVNDEAISISGTSLMGYIKTTYSDLVEKFGEPTYENGDKTTVEWSLQFFDGDTGDFVTATIYDWKMHGTPFGEYNWHIGGHGMEAVDEVYEAMGI